MTQSHNHKRATLPAADRETVGTVLQDVLVTLTDLSLTGKHAHWNVTGPHFRSLHLQLDEMIDDWRGAADDVAERAVALGQAPDGRAATVAADSELPALDTGPQRDRTLVDALTGILTAAAIRTRSGCDRIEDVDPTTADILHGVIAKLEEQLWMISVQTQ